MLGYGAGYSTSIWIYQLRSLVNPVVVGRYLGAAAVGVVALAIRLVENLSFVKQATFRLSISALARVQTSADRLRAATSEGMALQMLAFGPLLLVFALTGNWIVPRVFGPAWDRTLTVYPFIALGYLTNALFNLHASVLYVLRRNWQVTAFNLLHVALFAGAAAVLVRSAGLIGYGLAEVVAMGAYLLLHWVIVKETGTPDYKFAFTWWVCFSVPLFWRQLGYPALSPLLVLLLPYSRKRLMAYGSEIRRIMRARPGSAAPSQVVD
jgi:PST family polysaccharide transporter